MIMPGTTETAKRMGSPLPTSRHWTDGWMSGWLVANGRLSREDEQTLLRRREDSFREAALASGCVTEPDLLDAIAGRLRLPIVRIDAASVDLGLASLLPRDLALRFGLVPLSARNGMIEVACDDPFQPGLEEALRFATRGRVELKLAERAGIEAAQRRLYADPGVAGNLQGMLESLGARRPEVAGRAGERRFVPARVAEMVDAILADAIARRASDIHVEPSETGVRIRFRIDGVLREVGTLGPEYASSLVSRLKVLAELDIADRRRPQDGRAQATVQGRRVDLRVSTLPVGELLEKVVLRVLDTEANAPSLDELGFSAAELARLRDLARQHEGVVLVTGPTGSGKTTTLYGVLSDIQREGINIVTVEDPIEYRLPGLTQVQVNTRADLTFASALRSILRQDPDVVLVGEIRDATTADIAFKASMTGHQVFSTLHTNDAPSTVARLLDIGVDAVTIGAALKGVIAQRLLRRLCEDCRVPLDPAELPARQRALLPADPTGLFRAAGCAACDHTGYRGRVAIAEILGNTVGLARAVADRASQAEIDALCRQTGMISLWDSGLDRVLSGVTTLHELLDNVAPPAFVQETAPASASTPPHEVATTAAAAAMDQADIDALVAAMVGGGSPATVTVPPPVRTIGAATAGPTLVATAPGRVQRVLVVDEDFQHRQSMRRVLERQGYRVLEAANGQSVVDYLARLRPDLIVTELALPRLGGFELLRAMQDGELPAVPTVVLTAQDEPELRDWAIELGAADFVSKQIDPEAIGVRLADALRPRLVAA